MVSNAPAPYVPQGVSPNNPNAQSPSVQRAGKVFTIAQALAGGTHYNYTVDPNTGQTTKTPVPMGKGHIGLAIALEALAGGFNGLAAGRGQGVGAAGAAGVNTGMKIGQQRQQQQQQAAEQAQQDQQDQLKTLTQRAQIYEANSRTLLNTSEAEQQGADAIDKLVDINRQSGVLDTSPEFLDNGGQPMTQQELMDAMKSGSLSPTDQVGPVAGRTEVTRADGSKYWEATHLVIKDPNTPVTLTQEDYDRYAAGDIKGFPRGTKIGQGGYDVPLRVVQNANEQLAAHYLADQRLDDLRNVLDGTPQAKAVPSSIDFSKPGVDTAISRFQKYVSHNADNLNDPFLALQQMGADKRDPKTGAMQPNPDAKYVDAAAQAMGGWSVLEAAHNQITANKKAAADFAVIDTDAKANAVLAAPKRFSADQVSSAQRFLALSNSQGATKARQEARACAQADGSDVQAMYRFGKNPVTGENLSLDNAPPSALVDASGNVIPQDLVSAYKPTAQQRQTADTARQVLAISSDLQTALQQNPNLAGPLSGRSKAAIAKLGYGNKQSQKFLDDVSFLQSAATKMHTGRFSSEILKKMDNIIQPGMNVDQFNGALSSINDVANRYANEDRLTTVADYQRQQQQPLQVQTGNTGTQPNARGNRNAATPNAPAQRVVPAGATPGRDANGNIIGYKLANGQTVRF
jgi:hypothetical protein